MPSKRPEERKVQPRPNEAEYERKLKEIFKPLSDLHAVPRGKVRLPTLKAQGARKMKQLKLRNRKNLITEVENMIETFRIEHEDENEQPLLRTMIDLRNIAETHSSDLMHWKDANAIAIQYKKDFIAGPNKDRYYNKGLGKEWHQERSELVQIAKMSKEREQDLMWEWNDILNSLIKLKEQIKEIDEMVQMMGEEE